MYQILVFVRGLEILGNTVKSSIVKSLLILRHAKSSWKYPELNDHDIPLNKRGKNDAPRIGKILQKEKLIPDAILSSTAMRASATVESVVKACGYKGEVTLNRSLYAAGPETYLQLLSGLPNGQRRVLVVGHNPGIEELLELLTSEIHLLPTCSLAHLNLQIGGWSDIDFETTKGQLVDIWLPGDIT